jgi:hypothetical protein
MPTQTTPLGFEYESFDQESYTAAWDKDDAEWARLEALKDREEGEVKNEQE